jgi:hypothetical protein
MSAALIDTSATHTQGRAEMIIQSMPRIVAAVVAVVGLMCASAAMSDNPPAVSPDGLHLVKNTEFALVYVKPGASLKPYTKFAILDCFVSFKPNWREDMQTDYDVPITDDQIKQIEGELAAQFKKVFVAQLQQGGFQLVDTAAPDVLVLRPAIINLTMAAPTDMANPGMQTFSTSAGQMTLFLELYDSVTSQLLARVVDPESSSDYGVFTWQSGVGNVAAADGIMTKWSDTLRHYMEAAHGAE